MAWHPADTTRWPVYLTLATAVPCLVVALGLRECRPPVGAFAAALRGATANILDAARWILRDHRTPRLLLAGLVADSFVRLFLTFGSNYYRLIELPAFVNGLLGSSMALLGFAAAPLARRLVAARGPVANFLLVGAAVFVGLAGAALATPRLGVWVLVPLGLAMSGTSFFLSHYLNAWAPSALRATVLSFRGLVFNLGYGALGLAFATLTARLDAGDANATFRVALAWLPVGFLAAAGVVGVVAARWRGRA